MQTNAYQIASLSRPRAAMAANGATIAPLVAMLVAFLFVVAVVATRVGPADGRPLPAPRPLVPPPALAADFPEQSHIAACWSLADRSNALQAPRSDRASEVVGPLYADACQGA